MDKDFIKKEFDVSDDVLELAAECESELAPEFKKAEEIAEVNQLRVMKAFADNRVSETHFSSTTGYG